MTVTELARSIHKSELFKQIDEERRRWAGRLQLRISPLPFKLRYAVNCHGLCSSSIYKMHLQSRAMVIYDPKSTMFISLF